MNTSHGQADEARVWLNKLCSEEFSGRGYVNNGHKLAAAYIANEFAVIGLSPLGCDRNRKSCSKNQLDIDPTVESYQSNSSGVEQYYQYFNLSVNTFPDSIQFGFDSSTFIAGQDYLVEGESGSYSGKKNIIYLDKTNFKILIDSISFLGFENYTFVLDIMNVRDIDSTKMFNDLKYSLAQVAPVIWLQDAKLTWSVGREALTYPIISLKRNLYDQQKTAHFKISNFFLKNCQSQNVIGMIKGRKRKKYLILSAHYDHLGKMGQATFPGANDNASGVSMLLSLAKKYQTNKKRPKYNLIFIAFGGEEAGLLGSKHFVDNPLIDLKQTKFVINCDIMGTGDEGITVVNGTVYKEEFKKLSHINSSKGYLTQVKARGRSANSDHYWFTQKNVPAIFIYTLGGIKAYHDIYDRAETLPLSSFNPLFFLLTEFIDSF